MLTVRRRYHSEQKNYFEDLFENYGEIPSNHKEAIKLRMDYFKKFILQRSPTSYETTTEKDWAYIARREYFWDVTLRSLGDGFFAGNIACVFRMFLAKRFVIWPMFPVSFLVFFYRNQELFIFHNKKFFDMCNVGEQYEIGKYRNETLRECNKLLDREDF